MMITVLLLGGAGVFGLLYEPTDNRPRRATHTENVKQGSLHVASTPGGASILIDGKPTGLKTPATIESLPADRALKIGLLLDGYNPWSLDVLLSSGTTTSIRAVLTPEEKQRPSKGSQRPRKP